MANALARFSIGQCIHHRLFDYRGVIVDVDPIFLGTEAWYSQMAGRQPPKDAPWYHVLVDGTDRLTYVSEQNLEVDQTLDPIDHPLVHKSFAGFCDGVYQTAQRMH